MIVCVVDDLIFSIKIKTAARHLGVEVYFERARDQVLATIRDKRPSLAIFDLNSATLDPMGAITALKADPSLGAVRTLGYVAHVDGDTVAAARRAGIDEVLARSAFAERLGDILTSA